MQRAGRILSTVASRWRGARKAGNHDKFQGLPNLAAYLIISSAAEFAKGEG
jgi:hypothetical protein